MSRSPGAKCGKHLPQIGAANESILPTPKAAPENLEIWAFPGPNFPRISLAFSSCSFSFAVAEQSWRSRGSNTVSGHRGEKLCHIPGRAGFPGRGLPQRGTPPALDHWAAPPPGSSGTAPPSSTSPAYSRGSPTEGSPHPGHSWRTALSPACGWPPFPHGSALGPPFHLPPPAPFSSSR